MITTSNEINGVILRRNAVFLLMLIGLGLLSGCNLPSSVNTPDSSIYDSVSDLATQPVNIQFQLELPTPITGSEKPVIDILDDVSGLAHNNKRYELIALSDQVYALTLSVPSGSVIKYRYGKIDQEYQPEATPDGAPVLYRMVYAAKNEIVNDLLQAWQGEPITGGTGIFRGTLLDAENNQPIPDMLVCAGGVRTFTDANGKFLLEGLGEGTHNTVFYAMDGRYSTYQQGATISTGMATTAEVKLQPMPEVRITFLLSPPGEGLGAPIYLAGNILQLGNTFAELEGSMSVNPKRMPALKHNTDGSYSLTLTLFAGTDLRYRFTLGNGFWNAEQTLQGDFRVRQLIVPAQDAAINHTIDTWRSPNVEPITFAVTIPPGTAPGDEKFIQFRHDAWTPPIPMWSLGGGEYLYILFSPLAENRPIEFQFCRNAACDRATSAGAQSEEQQVLPSKQAQTVSMMLESWKNWSPLEKGTTVIETYVPIKLPSYQTVIELTPEMNTFWNVYAPAGIAEIGDLNADRVIISPQWTVSYGSPYLMPQFGLTPLTAELTGLIDATHSDGLAAGLFPQVGPHTLIESWWSEKTHTEAWWNEFFASYRRFTLNYANVAQLTGADALILGGKSLLPAFEGGILPDGSDSALPVGFDQDWLELISDIRSIYSGKLIWATHVNRDMDPLPDFIFQFDEIYAIVDSPLALGDHPTFEMIQSGFISVIDSQIYEIYRSTGKPLTVALAYPSVEITASGCVLVSETCYNDGLFRASELTPYMVHMADQALVYNAILPILASREWITGVSIRGYDPTVVIHDGASSIAGKPAQDVIEYWFSNMKP